MYSLLAAAMNSQLEEVSGKGAGISRAECERTERWNGLRAESHVCQDVHSNIRISNFVADEGSPQRRAGAWG
jgi:hypothetical protein